MTLILSCITGDNLIQVSDRRIVFVQRDGNVLVRDDTTNKVVVLNQQLALSFTGLATIGGQPTDTWLADVLSSRTSGSVEDIAALIGSRAEITFQQILIPKKNKRHAFVIMGWLANDDQITERDQLSPILLIISNAIDETGTWLNQANDHFTVFRRKFQQSESFMLEITGQPLSKQCNAQTNRLIRQCVKNKTGPAAIARAMADAIQQTALINKTVGSSLLMIGIPKNSIQNNRWLFTNELPNNKTATFLYIGRDSQTFQYGPIFIGGGSVSNIRIVKGLKARELARDFPEIEPPDTIVLSEWTGTGNTGDARRPILGDNYSLESWSMLTNALGWSKEAKCPYYGVLLSVKVDKEILERIDQDIRYVVVTRSREDADKKPSNDWLQRLSTWFSARNMPLTDVKKLVEHLNGQSFSQIIDIINKVLIVPKPEASDVKLLPPPDGDGFAISSTHNNGMIYSSGPKS